MMLLVDIGNTRIKWALWQHGHLHSIKALAYKQADINIALQKVWQAMASPSAIRVACVSSQQTQRQVLEIAELLWPEIKPVIVQTQETAYGLSNGYRVPEKLGIDRWLAMLAAWHDYAQALCVLDCGTAITLDIINAQGQHLGGMIMPGLDLMKHALSVGAADLFFCSESHPRGLARYTEAGIFNGSLNAVQGFVQVGLQLAEDGALLIITGGDGAFIAESLQLDCIVDNNLVFKGLALA